MPKYSVIVPTYNVEDYIEKCLNSILNQNFDDYEIIAVNDGSTDKSGEIVARIAEQNADKINVITQENKGLGGARNTGMAAAKGEYFIFVDSDDYITPDMFSKIDAFLTKTPVDLLCFDYERVDEDGNSFDYVQTHSSENTIFNLETEPAALFMTNSVWNKVYHRSLFEKAGVLFPDRAWFEDLATVVKLYPYAQKIGYINESFYKYLQRRGSIMHNSNADRNIDMITVVGGIIEYYKEHGLFEKYYDELEFLAVFHIMTLCTMRVAGINFRHPLLKKFYDFTKEMFPNFENNKYISTQFGYKYKVVFAFSKRKMFFPIYLISKVYYLLKK